MKHTALLLIFATSSIAAPLPGTQPLTTEGDLSAQMVAGISRWLDRETGSAAAARPARWKALDAAAQRKLVRERLGMLDATAAGALETFAPLGAAANAHAIHVRWPVVDDVHGEGVLLRPQGASKATVIAVPDADQVPESWSVAWRLRDQGFTVLVPALVDRRDKFSGNALLNRWANQPHREWIYRQAFEAGRTLTGYEVQSVLRALDALGAEKAAIVGYGEGALIALHAAALDQRFAAAVVGGYFGPRERLWSEPIYRNTFGTLRDFADAELAALIAPRALIVEQSAAPVPAPLERKGRPPTPGEIKTPAPAEVQAEVKRAGVPITLTDSADASLRALVKALGIDSGVKPASAVPVIAFPNDERQERLVRGWENHTQRLLRDSDVTRNAADLWKKIKDRAAWPEVQKTARRHFDEQVIGKLPVNFLPPNARSRPILEKEKWTGYDVMLDVHPDVFAWGVLLVPKDLKPGERRPVVVTQHGLEGLPMDTITDDKTQRAWAAYKAFSAQLADRGFIVFAPHNPYRGQDAFRVLQRKAQPLGLTLFSFINAQHEVITRWLAAQPFVDPERIGFYGLSYGGKTAMRTPAVVDRYCLSVCSGDFNEWVLKNGSVTYPSSYMFTGEYEIFEWDLAHTFNYAEMALLIAPRPFMVERGHDDGVATSEWVGYEMGKVLRGYSKLGIPERATIEWFDGPHTINGIGSFKFLHEHLKWPEPR
ncbi:MAG: dienelactone hydrolase family protein [Chthoniobacteraceae bacterium]